MNLGGVNIFDLCITALNVLLSVVNLLVLYKILRPYNRKVLERYDEQRRINLNFAQVKAIIDEANKTEGRQRQAPNATAPIFNGSQSVSKPETGLRDLPSRPLN